MKIIYDFSAFVMQSNGGVSRVLYELFSHVSMMPDCNCVIFAGFHKNRYLKEAPARLKQRIIGLWLPECIVRQRIFMPINRFLFRIYTIMYKPDVCHYTYFFTPRVPDSCKAVVTVHDMIHELYPKTFSPSDPHREWKRQAVIRTDGIVCVSNNTKRDLERLLDVSRKKISVIPHGNSIRQNTRATAPHDFNYFLYVGNRASKYKNFSVLAQSIPKIKSEMDCHLICFGGGEFTDKELRMFRDLQVINKVHFVAGSDDLLASYYEYALALVYPSIYEGFGLPPIEAMSCRCPVIASSAPPMPEILAESVLYFNPDSINDLVRCMKEVCNGDCRRRLIETGEKQAELYQWNHAAMLAVQFYKSL